MIHEHATDETRERAALYALGTLDSAEAKTFESHLQEGCSSCQAELIAFQNVVGHLGVNANIEMFFESGGGLRHLRHPRARLVDLC